MAIWCDDCDDYTHHGSGHKSELDGYYICPKCKGRNTEAV